MKQTETKVLGLFYYANVSQLASQVSQVEVATHVHTYTYTHTLLQVQVVFLLLPLEKIP
jgi:hypothetical protein